MAKGRLVNSKSKTRISRVLSLIRKENSMKTRHTTTPLDSLHSSASIIKRSRKGRQSRSNTSLGRVFPPRVPRLNFHLDEHCWGAKTNTESAGVKVLEVQRQQHTFKGRVLAGHLRIQLLVKPASGLHAEVLEIISGMAPVRSQVLRCGIWEDSIFLSTAPPWSLMCNVDTHSFQYTNLLNGECLALEVPPELMEANPQAQLVGCLRGNPRSGSGMTVLVTCTSNGKDLFVGIKRGGPRAAWSVMHIADETMRHRLEGASVIDGVVFWISNGTIVECLEINVRHQKFHLGTDFRDDAAKSLIPSHPDEHVLYIAEAVSGHVAVTNTLDPELLFIRAPYTISHLFAVSGREGVSLPLSFCPAPARLFFGCSGDHHVTQFSGGMVQNHFPCPFTSDGEHEACPCSASWFPYSLLS